MLKGKNSEDEQSHSSMTEEIFYINYDFTGQLKTHYQIFIETYMKIKNKEQMSSHILTVTQRPDHLAALKTLSPVSLELIPHKTFEQSLNPDNSFYHYLMGNSLFQQEKFQESAYAFQYASILDPSLHNYRYNLGCACMKIFEFRKAQREFNKAIKLKDNIADYYHNMGIAYYCLDDLCESIKALEYAIKLDRRNERFRNNLEKVKAMRVFMFWKKLSKDWSNW
jgi:tetratricopeptide (TPR) repeat protein